MLGGPLHWLGCRLSLVREGTHTVRLGLALSLLAWGVLIVLALLQGLGLRLFSPAVMGVHVRFLVAVPLFFLCESLVAPGMAEFVRNIVHSGLVPESEMPTLASNVRRFGRMNNSWLAEVVFLLAAIASPIGEQFVRMPGMTANWTSIPGGAGNGLTWAHGWYLGFCLPLFRFLILRWVWRLGLWSYFLWRVRSLKLHLIPTHSDGAAGLGYLDVVQEHFAPLAIATSAVLSASFLEDIFSGTMAFEELYLLIPVVLLLNVVLFISPLFIFSGKLWVCRATGLNEYMAMAARYVHAFDRKWVRGGNASGESQLGTTDLQSLADLTNSVRVIHEMHWAPISQRLLMTLAVSTVVPLLPLALVKYPLAELAKKLFGALAGL